MVDINNWLKSFKTKWINKNIDGVLSLFSDDVSYFETTTKRLNGFTEIRNEWNSILEQNNIEIDFNIISKDDDKYKVGWKLKYVDNQSVIFDYKGTYLIKLNEENKCEEFIQFCEE